jgi:hypothetical protein
VDITAILPRVPKAALIVTKVRGCDSPKGVHMIIREWRERAGHRMRMRIRGTFREKVVPELRKVIRQFSSAHVLFEVIVQRSIR